MFSIVYFYSFDVFHFRVVSLGEGAGIWNEKVWEEINKFSVFYGR